MAAVTPSEALKLLEAGAVVVDVRTPAQFAHDPWPGSVSLPWERVAAGDGPSVELDRALLVVCAVGGVSELAALYLTQAGFQAAYSVRGGLQAMRAAAQSA